MLLDHSFALLDSKSGEGEHANLGSDVRPVTFDTGSLEGGAESITHIIHSLADGDEFVEPLLAHRGVVQDSSCNSGTVLGRRRVVSSDNDLDLGEELGSRSGISADEVESTGTFTIESHDLGERLSNDHLEALIKEKTKAIGILIEGS